MSTTTLRNRNASPISPAFADFAVNNIHLRRFSIHAAHVIAKRVEALYEDAHCLNHVSVPSSWKRSPILYLLDCQYFLEGAGELYRVAKEMLGDGDVTHERNDVVEMMLEAAEDKWSLCEYRHLCTWCETFPNWSDEERAKFLDELFPNSIL